MPAVDPTWLALAARGGPICPASGRQATAPPHVRHTASRCSTHGRARSPYNALAHAQSLFRSLLRIRVEVTALELLYVPDGLTSKGDRAYDFHSVVWIANS